MNRRFVDIVLLLLRYAGSALRFPYRLRKCFILLPVLAFFHFNLNAQSPPNDNCSGAETINPNGTCYPGTTVGANDSWVSTVGCQSGNNHPDVWYTFIATGTSLSVTVTAGTLTGNIEFILVSSTSTCSGLALTGSLCGASVLTGTINGLQVGTRYYYTISSSTGSQGTFTTCVTNTTPPSPGQDCTSAAILCNANTFSEPTSNAGYGIQEVNTTNSCWGSGGERQSKWFKFTASNSGTLQFNIKPVNLSDDYDWALWDVTTLGCPTTANNSQQSIACNWSGCNGSTGLSSCPSLEPGANNSGAGCLGTYSAWNAPITLTAGHTYALLVDNYTTSNNGFSLTFGGACNGGTAIIGPDATFTYTSTVCGTYSFTPTYPTFTSTYLWDFGDGQTSTLQNPTHTYSTSGSFIVTLQITDALGCVATYSQTITITSCCLAITTQPVSVTACNGGSATFTVVATGNAPLTYQWRKSGTNLFDGGNISGATTASLTINPVGAGDVGSYDVVITNACGTITSNTVTLSLPSALSAGAHNIAPVTACIGFNPAQLNINSPAPSGGSTPYSYQWYENSTQVGTDSSSYDPPAPTTAGTYNYYCVVTDGCGSTATTQPKVVTIVPDPSATISGGGTVCQNDLVILIANITDGTGTYSYQWQSGNSSTGPWSNIAGATSATYSPSTSTTGTTWYLVVINANGAGCNNPVPSSVAVIVNPKPTPITITHN